MTRSVLEKLGFKPGMSAQVRDLPDALADSFAPAIAAFATDPDWIIAFCSDKAAVDRAVPALAPVYRRGGHLWLAYPKLSSRVKTDITRDRGWEALVTHDLLPVTQIAIDATWSALRWRYRDEIARLTRRF